MSLALLKKFSVDIADTRLYSYADPWKSFVPDFVAKFTTPPEARPNSAVKLFVKTLYSCTESSGMGCPTVPTNSLLLAVPSNRMLVLAARNPLKETPAPEPVLPIAPVGLPSEAADVKRKGIRISIHHWQLLDLLAVDDCTECGRLCVHLETAFAYNFNYR